MNFRIDTDIWFVFSILFIATLALFILLYIAWPYFIRRKQTNRVRNKVYRRHQNYQRVEEKYTEHKMIGLREDNQALLTNLTDSLHRLLKSSVEERDLVPFFSDFEKVYPHFGNTLQRLVPDISAHEIKLCALLRLNLSSKEMGQLLNITQESVNKARYRLRKKMELDSKEDLTVFILNI